MSDEGKTIAGQVVSQPPVPTGAAALMTLIERAATDPNFDVAKLEKLLEMRDRWQASEARTAWVSAMNAFKADAPSIAKNKRAGFDSKRTGDRTEYAYATLDQITDIIGPALSKHGLSYRWEVEQGEHEIIRVTCALSHVLGHIERVQLSAKPDTTGNKNAIQAIGSATTYLSRYTLLLACGLATEEMDDDGKKTGNGALIIAEQKEELTVLIKETKSSLAKLLTYLAIPALDELPAKRFAEVKGLLEARRK